MRATNPRHDWSALATLVDTLLDTAPEERDALIDELSAGDPAWRSELERLVEDCDHEPAFFSRPATERFSALFSEHRTRFPDSLAERYRSTKELGHGGMATVYLARDQKHARDVAVKVVHPEVALALGPDRFLREIEIVAQLHHPHIVPLYDSGETDGVLFYVMPYVAESSLRQRLTQGGPLPVDDALLILRDVCDALGYAHQRGIVHRDIKPDNVLLSGRHAMITDFGVAQAITEPTSRTAGATAPTDAVTLGSPAYMAPEQIAGGAEVDQRVDIYAIGVMAYELLAGRPPFVGDSRQAVLRSHLSDAPAPLTTYRPDVPAVLAAFVAKCMEKEPDHRWSSVDEMVQRLEALARGWTTLREASWRARWANARIDRVTDFPGSEVDAAISADGRLVAFLADRDGVFDAFVTHVGSDHFVNLTGGRFPQLFNEDVRNVGFSADASHVWFRVADITSPASVSIVPTSGGPVRPLLNTAVMAVWSPDGSTVAYHETTPGDPIYIADADGGNPRRIFVAKAGVHSHHLAWSLDGRFLYFSHGLPPDEMDIWRIRSDGSRLERITAHNSTVAYPALLDDHTLFYTATAEDGSGPWLFATDIEDRVPHRVSTAVEHYLSIATSTELAGGRRRLVATVSNPTVQLWSVPISDGVADEETATRMTLPTKRSAAPRYGPDSALWYLASRGGADGVWRLVGGRASEVWKPSQGAVVGAVAVSPNGRSVCFPIRRGTQSTLYCASVDGTGSRAIAESLDVRGAASWSPDGKWIAVAAKEEESVRIFKIPVDGGPAIRLVDSVSSNPVWSPDGRFIVYSGTPRARSVPLMAVTPEGEPYDLAPLSVDRVGDSYRFLPNGNALVVKVGGFRHQNLWLFDVSTGHRRPLTALRPGESLQRFDVSPDGTHIVLERVRENSDVVLIDLPPR